MGTICILLGVIVLVMATLGGFYGAHAIITTLNTNELYKTLLGIQDASKIYIIVVGVCFVVGLLICLGLVMNGMIYNRVSKSHQILERIVHH